MFLTDDSYENIWALNKIIEYTDTDNIDMFEKEYDKILKSNLLYSPSIVILKIIDEGKIEFWNILNRYISKHPELLYKIISNIKLDLIQYITRDDFSGDRKKIVTDLLSYKESVYKSDGIYDKIVEKGMFDIFDEFPGETLMEIAIYFKEKNMLDVVDKLTDNGKKLFNKIDSDYIRDIVHFNVRDDFEWWGKRYIKEAQDPAFEFALKIFKDDEVLNSFVLNIIYNNLIWDQPSDDLRYALQFNPVISDITELVTVPYSNQYQTIAPYFADKVYIKNIKATRPRTIYNNVKELRKYYDGKIICYEKFDCKYYNKMKNIATMM